ncbi:MAG: hypothetical protein HRT58_13820 [Crocinitomicaceae bacterium]|nr:hypothetical protein [Crocinitomicaceae bacterium]
MKRTILVGASMFALISGVSAQVDNTQDFEAFQADWKKSHNMVEINPAQYEQMKTDWYQLKSTNERATEIAYEAQFRGLPADFPFKKDTGNAVADEDAYQLEKALWIENNKELYEQMMSKTVAPTKEQLEERRQVLNNQNK